MGYHLRPMQFFTDLTPERILEALETVSGLRCTGRCLALNSVENRVFEVEVEVDADKIKSNAEKFRILKFYRPGRWTREQILEEHQFLLDLTEVEIPVGPPIAYAGQTLHKLANTEISYAVFAKIQARNLDEITDDILLRVGRLLARVHNVGALKKSSHRMTLSPKTFGLDNLAFLQTNKIIPAQIEAAYCQTVEKICQISELLFQHVSMQRIHGDCHIGNILMGREFLSLVDFDDMLTGPCVQDVWLLIGGRAQEAQPKLEILLKGYEELRKFDRNSLRLIEPLRALRYIHYSAWIARRWQDPAFPKLFVNFGSPRYWEEQLNDLREQLGIIQELV